MDMHRFLAFDLGAESGRAMLGTLENGRLRVEELHRFANETITIAGHLHWNILKLFDELKKGLELATAADILPPLESVGIDTWGVDFGLLDAEGQLLELPYSYRDRRTEGMMETFFQRVPRERVYELTGIQFMPLNTLFQLFSMALNEAETLKKAAHLLFMPDLLNFLFCGEKRSEFTFATTSQLFNPLKGEWENELLRALGVNRSLMQEIVQPGTLLGRLRSDVCRQTGCERLPLVAVASHDTASAVAAVPAEGDDWVYISSGTWSLMGIEVSRPIITEASLARNFTNEGGVGQTFRFLKNITGLWLLQGCCKSWQREFGYSYDDLLTLAETAPPFRYFVNPNHLVFLNPEDMVAAIQEYCRLTRQGIPCEPAEIVRCVLESLAFTYRRVLDELSAICGHPLRRIHIIGGGSRNRILCQLTADATGLPVRAGPREATAAGNILVQAMVLGYLSSVGRIREVVRQSFAPVPYEPLRLPSGAEWERAYARFREISERI